MNVYSEVVEAGTCAVGFVLLCTAAFFCGISSLFVLQGMMVYLDEAKQSCKGGGRNGLAVPWGLDRLHALPRRFNDSVHDRGH